MGCSRRDGFADYHEKAALHWRAINGIAEVPFTSIAFGSLTISIWRLTALRPRLATGLPLSCAIVNFKRTEAFSLTERLTELNYFERCLSIRFFCGAVIG